MEIGLQSIKKEEKPILRNLLELYQYDFSEFEGGDVGDQGLFGYDDLDHYWTEPGRFAFFIHCDSQLAGFALVRDIPDGSDGVAHVMAEYFVLRKYRRKHVGQTAVAQESCNHPA
jgi:predicted acetyltransferase